LHVGEDLLLGLSLADELGVVRDSYIDNDERAGDLARVVLFELGLANDLWHEFLDVLLQFFIVFNFAV